MKTSSSFLFPFFQISPEFCLFVFIYFYSSICVCVSACHMSVNDHRRQNAVG